MVGGCDYNSELLCNVHLGLDLPAGVTEAQVVRGDYLYYHYGCDGFDDRGWGCGYRTLMTLCSWVRGQQIQASTIPLSLPPVPSNRRVQEILVEIGDKEQSFIGSRQWIGSVEVSYMLDTLYSTSCKILHIHSGAELRQHLETLRQHFRQRGSPVMMGGDTDASSKGIMGVCQGPSESYLLVVDVSLLPCLASVACGGECVGRRQPVKHTTLHRPYKLPEHRWIFIYIFILLKKDPHFWGVARDSAALQSQQWVKWHPLSDFIEGSFYNMCLPQLTAPEMCS